MNMPVLIEILTYLLFNSITPAQKVHNFIKCIVSTEIFGYSDTAYIDTPLTVTVLVNPLLFKSVTVSKYLLTVTLFDLVPRVSL